MAVEYLSNQGLYVIETNYRNRFGEIDIIARDCNTIVFVEVKYRKTASYGYPEEAVDRHKIMKICRTADYYICHNNIKDSAYRFDVVAILGNKIRWYQNAFDYA